jgi:hypothetical protein
MTQSGHSQPALLATSADVGSKLTFDLDPIVWVDHSSEGPRLLGDDTEGVTGETMNCKIRQLILACAFFAASFVIVIAPAKAEMLNLVCIRNADALAYWVDFDRNTITYANMDNQQVVAMSVKTYSVQITPESFNFSTGMGAVTINRLTGVNYWSGPPVQIFQCSKSTLPFPASKF